MFQNYLKLECKLSKSCHVHTNIHKKRVIVPFNRNKTNSYVLDLYGATVQSVLVSTFEFADKQS